MPSKQPSRVFVTPSGQRLYVTEKALKFVEALLGEAHGVHTVAARMAGYKNPSSRGKELAEHLRDLITYEQGRREAEARMDQKEILTHLATIARDSSDSVRLRALEILAKIEGLLSDKTTGGLDRHDIHAEIDRAIKTLQDVSN